MLKYYHGPLWTAMHAVLLKTTVLLLLWARDNRYTITQQRAFRSKAHNVQFELISITTCTCLIQDGECEGVHDNAHQGLGNQYSNSGPTLSEKRIRGGVSYMILQEHNQ